MKDMTGRAQRIVQALLKAQDRLARLKAAKGEGVMGLAYSAEQKARIARYEEKIAEYTASLQNLRQFGAESIPTGNPVGVEIGVPHAGGTN